MARLVTTSQLGSPSDTYFFSLAQIAGAFAVIGSDDNLRLFDPSQLSVQHVFTKCNKGVECMTTGGDQSLYTAGRDGVVRGWDSRSKAQTVEIKEPRSAGCSAIACQDNYIAAGTESTKEGLGDVSVHIFDTRKVSAPLRTYAESHTDTVTTTSWHPMQRNLLMTGSTDGLVSIFDVEQAEEEDAIQQVLNPRSAVHCSAFLTDHQAYVLSTDEQFTIYGLNKTGTAEEEALPVAQLGDMRPRLDCMYVVDLLQNSFITSPLLAYGHNEKQKLQLTALSGADYALGQTIDLPGAHGDEVVRDIKFASATAVITCGEDGHVRTWDISQVSQADHEPSKVSRKKARKDNKADRFAPY